MTLLRILPAEDIDFASTVSEQTPVSGAGKAGDAYPNDSAASSASRISAVGATNKPGPQKASVITGEEPRNGNRPEGNGGELRAMITADSTSCEGSNGLQPNGPHASDSLSNHAGTSGVPPAGSVNLGRPPATPDGKNPLAPEGRGGSDGEMASGHTPSGAEGIYRCAQQQIRNLPSVMPSANYIQPRCYCDPGKPHTCISLASRVGEAPGGILEQRNDLASAMTAAAQRGVAAGEDIKRPGLSADFNGAQCEGESCGAVEGHGEVGTGALCSGERIRHYDTSLQLQAVNESAPSKVINAGGSGYQAPPAGLSKIEQAAQELDDALFLLWPGKSEAAQRVIKAIKLIKEAKEITQ